MDANLTRTALVQLEQALINHERWSEAINRTLVCRLPHDTQDIGADAHRLCRFGQWYYGDGAKSLQSHPGFSEIACEHERMHQAAARLLCATSAGGTPAIDDFDHFSTAKNRMRLEVLTMKRELEDALRNLDPLTGAQNRTSMLPRLREQLELVKRNVHVCALAMLDIDCFKSVNDDYGHIAGDNVLRAFADLIIGGMRSHDHLFRYGGEEFLICAPGADIADANCFLERLRTTFAEQAFTFGNRPAFHVTVSAGLVMLDPDAAVEVSIDRADRALYAAKMAGRNQVRTWSPALH